MSDPATERKLGALEVPRRLVVALVVVLAAALIATAAWFGDLALRGATEQRVASELRTTLGTPTDPTVIIAGWPFVTQAAERRLEQVTVDAVDSTPQGLDISLQRIHGVGHDVTFSADQKTVTIGSIDGDVSIAYSEVTRLAGREVTFVAPDWVQVQAIPDILEQPVPVIVTGKPVVRDDRTLGLAEAEIQIVGVELSAETSQQIVDRFGAIPLKLPEGLVPTTVTAAEGGIGLAFTGEQLIIQR